MGDVYKEQEQLTIKSCTCEPHNCMHVTSRDVNYHGIKTKRSLLVDINYIYNYCITGSKSI